MGDRQAVAPGLFTFKHQLIRPFDKLFHGVIRFCHGPPCRNRDTDFFLINGYILGINDGTFTSA